MGTAAIVPSLPPVGQTMCARIRRAVVDPAAHGRHGRAPGVWSRRPAVSGSGRPRKRKRREYQAVLNERSRVGRELHDTLEQGLAGIALQLEAVAGSLQTAPEAARQSLDVATADAALQPGRSAAIGHGPAVAGAREPRPRGRADEPRAADDPRNARAGRRPRRGHAAAARRIGGASPAADRSRGGHQRHQALGRPTRVDIKLRFAVRGHRPHRAGRRLRSRARAGRARPAATSACWGFASASTSLAACSRSSGERGAGTRLSVTVPSRAPLRARIRARRRG